LVHQEHSEWVFISDPSYIPDSENTCNTISNLELIHTIGQGHYQKNQSLLSCLLKNFYYPIIAIEITIHS